MWRPEKNAQTCGLLPIDGTARSHRLGDELELVFKSGGVYCLARKTTEINEETSGSNCEHEDQTADQQEAVDVSTQESGPVSNPPRAPVGWRLTTFLRSLL